MPAFRSAVNSCVSSSVDGTRGSVQGKANPHKTASQAIAAHVVQRHPILGPTSRHLSSLQILTCSLFTGCQLSQIYMAKRRSRTSFIGAFSDGEATTCFLSVHHCPHLVTRTEAARRLVRRFGCVWIRYVVDSPGLEGTTAEHRCELDRLLLPFLLNDVSPWMIRTHSCLSFVGLPHDM